jgi:archaellum component FlaF (FlaF/FlaG flagellin family)
LTIKNFYPHIYSFLSFQPQKYTSVNNYLLNYKYESSTGKGYVNVYANGTLVLSVTGLTNVNNGQISRFFIGTDSGSGGETTSTINYWNSFMVDTVPITPYMPST